jgi:hypothetical protein
MEKYLSDVIEGAMAVDRPKEVAECAVEKYLQMTSGEANIYIGELLVEWAEEARFNREEHSDWIHSGITVVEPNGPRLLDVFFLKYPVPVIPEEHELGMEYFWKLKNKPSMMSNISCFEDYRETVLRFIASAVETYATL